MSADRGLLHHSREEAAEHCEVGVVRFTSIFGRSAGDSPIVEPLDVRTLSLHMQQEERELRQHLNGGLGFGDGINSDNIFGVWVSYTSNAVANTEDAVTHNLGLVPVGFLVMDQDKAGVFYRSGTAWTSTQIFLKCSLATVVVKMFILAPSNTQH